MSLNCVSPNAIRVSKKILFTIQRGFTMTQKFDTIIIGAGIIGCGIAFELSKKGYNTLNIDKLHDAGAGPTGNSCGCIRFFYSTFNGVALAYEGYHYWKNWAGYLETEDERGYARYRQLGSIMFETRDNNFERILQLYRQVGVQYERWDMETLKKKMPIYDTRAFWPPRPIEDPTFWETPAEQLSGAIFTPESGYVTDPQLAAHNLRRAAEAKGGKFLFNSEVVEIRKSGGRVAGVTLKEGQQIDAPVVVNVAGPHSFIINRLAGVETGMKIKTRALRHEVHHVPAPPGFDFEKDGHPTSDGDAGIYFRPEVGNHIAVGTEDPECDPREWVDDPDDFNREITNLHWKAQVYRLARRIPDLPIPNQKKGVVDLYDVSDDWIPIYDKSDLPGFYMAIGTSGNQFKNGAVAGYLMAQLIDACERGHNHDSNPVKITGRYTGLTIDAGAFSRLREINPDSSFTVRG